MRRLQLKPLLVVVLLSSLTGCASNGYVTHRYSVSVGSYDGWPAFVGGYGGYYRAPGYPHRHHAPHRYPGRYHSWGAYDEWRGYRGGGQIRYGRHRYEPPRHSTPHRYGRHARGNRRGR